jgi:2-oxoisovalerate dehydrogenase E2 component (dihydrolipoyl transacylase)
MTLRDFHLPDLGEGLHEAVLVQWLVAEGQVVKQNQPIAEIETAKATVEITSPYEGRLLRLHCANGSTVAVGRPIATYEVEAPEAAPEADGEDGRGRTPGRVDPGAVAPSEPAGVGDRDPSPIPASPAARSIARERGIELSDVRGSGEGGRVTREDVHDVIRAVEAHPRSRASRPSRDIPVSSTRSGIAERLAQSAAVPQSTTFRTVECSELERLRRELAVSPLPIVVRALAEACIEHPLLNAAWAGSSIRVHGRIDAGIATDTERGLVVPVVRDAGGLGILGLAAEISRLAAAARRGGLTPMDVGEATITVSNTGSYGSESGTPLLNPGNAVTLSLGRIAPRALVVDGSVVARPACTLSVTFDHRVLDGATVGRGLGRLVDLLESREELRGLPA